MNRLNCAYSIIVRRFCTVENAITHPKVESTSSYRQLVPKEPIKSKIDPQKLPPKTTIDADTIALLERLSLVDCAYKKGIETLEAAIEFADQIQQVDTEGVEPLFTVLEDIPLRLREDKVTEGNCRSEVLQNAVLSEDDYFVAPPGNIPLATREDLLFENKNKTDQVELESTLIQKNIAFKKEN